MRKLFILAGFIICNHCSAQTNTFPSSGNVGVGTTSPGSALTIKGGGTGVSIQPGSAPYFGTLAFNRESATGAIFDSNGFAFQINNGGTDTNLHFQVWTGGGGLVTNEALVIGSNGNVGVGVSDTKGYKMAVAGSMIAESVKVKLQNTWPDYVFAKSYELPSLKSTEQHIKENGHLLGIPSAAEVKASGIDLGEKNAKLLQKIEELTLYMIEKDKQLQKVEQQNDAYEARLKSIEKLLFK